MWASLTLYLRSWIKHWQSIGFHVRFINLLFSILFCCKHCCVHEAKQKLPCSLLFVLSKHCWYKPVSWIFIRIWLADDWEPQLKTEYKVLAWQKVLWQPKVTPPNTLRSWSCLIPCVAFFFIFPSLSVLSFVLIEAFFLVSTPVSHFVQSLGVFSLMLLLCPLPFHFCFLLLLFAVASCCSVVL